MSVSSSVRVPSVAKHSVPLFLGAGLSHFLCRVRVPLPHVTEHSDVNVQSLNTPFTTEDILKYKKVLFSYRQTFE